MDAFFFPSIISLGVLGVLFGGGLAYAARKFAIEVDPRVAEVEETLPGANCGACGWPGCGAYAEAVVLEGAPTNACVPGGTEVAAAVSAIMGVEVEEKVPMVAVVQCKGGHEQAKRLAQYNGILDCGAAQMVAGGAKACIYGCLGFGSCVAACPFDAMGMSDNGLPVVFEDQCTGCGVCVRTCPRGIMKLIPRTQKVYLGCVSRGRGKEVKAVCEMGCIGCARCASKRTTPSGVVKMSSNLPVLPPDWSDYEAAVESCPSNCFVVRNE